MTSSRAWNPSKVHFSKVRAPMTPKLEPVRMSESTHGYEYVEPASDEALLHAIDLLLADIHGRMISKMKTRRMASVTREPPALDVEARRNFVSTERHAKITADKLANRFFIGPLKAKDTIRVTTQRGLRSSLLTIARRY